MHGKLPIREFVALFVDGGLIQATTLHCNTNIFKQYILSYVFVKPLSVQKQNNSDIKPAAMIVVAIRWEAITDLNRIGTANGKMAVGPGFRCWVRKKTLGHKAIVKCKTMP